MAPEGACSLPGSGAGEDPARVQPEGLVVGAGARMPRRWGFGEQGSLNAGPDGGRLGVGAGTRESWRWGLGEQGSLSASPDGARVVEGSRGSEVPLAGWVQGERSAALGRGMQRGVMPPLPSRAVCPRMACASPYVKILSGSCHRIVVRRICSLSGFLRDTTQN